MPVDSVRLDVIQMWIKESVRCQMRIRFLVVSLFVFVFEPAYATSARSVFHAGGISPSMLVAAGTEGSVASLNDAALATSDEYTTFESATQTLEAARNVLANAPAHADGQAIAALRAQLEAAIDAQGAARSALRAALIAELGSSISAQDRVILEALTGGADPRLPIELRALGLSAEEQSLLISARTKTSAASQLAAQPEIAALQAERIQLTLTEETLLNAVEASPIPELVTQRLETGLPAMEAAWRQISESP